VGCFLVAYVALGMFYLPGFLKILAGLAGAGLVVAGSRGVAHPKSSALFWCGLFWTIAARPMPPLAFALGLVLALAGVVAFIAATRGRRSLSRV
jgi:hypothetical protein